MKKNIYQKGLSLVEVLVMIAVLGIIAYALSDLLSRVFQGSDKTRLLGVIKQNGEYALNIMGDTIRTSGAVICTSPGGDVVAVSRNDTYTRFELVPEVGNVNGYVAKDEPIPTFLVNTPTQAARLCDTTDVAITNQVFLTDRNTTTGVSVTTGSFSRIIDPAGKDTVIISFALRQGPLAANNFFNRLGATGTETFQTTVKVR